MPEFLVRFSITFPPGTPQNVIADLYRREEEIAAPMIREGLFRRVWRIPGSRDHWALWWAPDADFVHRAYASFPIWQAGYGRAEVHPLADNPNDPGWPVKVATEPSLGKHGDLPLTWPNLARMIAVGETPAPEVGLHMHPGSATPREIHFMVDGQKVAEIGPPSEPDTGKPEGKAAGYVSFMAMWEHQPVMHSVWRERIARDNGLEVPEGMLTHYDYDAALAAPRHSGSRTGSGSGRIAVD